MQRQGFTVRANGIFGFIFLMLILVGLFFIAKGAFRILTFAAPVFLLLALIINYRTILGYFKFILSLLQRSTLTGIIAILLSIIGFPVLSGILFGKAIVDRRIRKFRKLHEANESPEFSEYEEVIKPSHKEDLELPPIEKSQTEKKDNRYENLF
jgi:small-conductance mechanosensitive channel